jgi:ABC-type Fe3+-hydroxamate transport system substrate-binding protein
MAVLKSGSKGTDVKNVQTLLNKAGAKPKLKVDGIFGPLTEAAVKAFQKKCKLKPDGIIGKKTMPVLKFGRPLPVMTEEDFSKRVKYAKQVRVHNKQMITSYELIEKSLTQLAKITAKETPKAGKAVAENQVIWEKIITMSEEVAAKQVAFAAIVEKSPEKAEKLLRECEDLVSKVEAYSAANLLPNLEKANNSLSLIRLEMELAQGLFKKQIDAIAKDFKRIKESLK